MDAGDFYYNFKDTTKAFYLSTMPYFTNRFRPLSAP